MCIGIPMQVVELAEGRALCREGEQLDWIDTRLIDPPDAGEWLLVFAGAARERISSERAGHINNALAALKASARGDRAGIDELFADLVGREPQLPPHLQPHSNSGQQKDN
ncbi:Hydrogenase maturation protein HupF/HypC/HoxL [Marinobacterium lacunae]|uniref:Hydrogenase maturation protein HupF/HypC/HoxL n=1 Tax=Marinobacterium lacunae TaxID=1232683 RepID=A0A081G4G4_9GAMM|nr:HypC/HybG/HupF family hydrogenase formation chaperone [Marinobacterium lacunae]KEA65669.1 Hydrogenase maturation protein HupF/HypC/HoxL [Marinobacterium lacunae]